MERRAQEDEEQSEDGDDSRLYETVPEEPTEAGGNTSTTPPRKRLRKPIVRASGRRANVPTVERPALDKNVFQPTQRKATREEHGQSAAQQDTGDDGEVHE